MGRYSRKWIVNVGYGGNVCTSELNYAASRHFDEEGRVDTLNFSIKRHSSNKYFEIWSNASRYYWGDVELWTLMIFIFFINTSYK